MTSSIRLANRIYKCCRRFPYVCQLTLIHLKAMKQFLPTTRDFKYIAVSPQ
ncbi:unknown [Prevotella sp. CAG:924]|nr:unknown [Prevotella sp. CAG:924]